MDTPKITAIEPPYDMKDDNRFRADGTFYLIRHNGRWYAGTVEKQWYGWNFDAVYDAGLQMDSSGLEAVYEIEGKAERPAPIFEILADALAEERELDDA